ncbi:MAG: helix-turn-helix domain-containing protein [Actinobacteria bacterium]|uniref:Unannotated protein n=1 Tax=freshwater metagenome TaxID=449393 RepID=A0A6J7G9Q3_9ZZZZ|nr:helix-turn-helix domain-containing protein [Actinomycetota bacterium]
MTDLVTPAPSVSPGPAQARAQAAAASPSQTLSRGIRVLEVLAESDEALSIAALAEALDVHRSIAYRILRTLEDHGLVARDGAGLVSLAPRMAYLARNVASGLATVALPELIQAANDLGMTVFIAALDHGECITLASAEPSGAPAALVQRPGSRHSFVVGAPGIAIQSSFTPAEWATYAPGESARPEAAEVTVRGYATSHDEVIAGVTSVAVPLRLAGQMPCAVAAVFVTRNIDLAEVALRLQACVRQIIAAFE